jgi:hypothetical protein
MHPLSHVMSRSHTQEHNIYYFNKLTGASSWTHPLEDHFRSLFIKCKVEKEKTKLAEKRAKERRKRKEAGLEEATSSESERDDDGAELGDR